MPLTLQLDNVAFGFQPVRDKDGRLEMMALTFTDPSGVLRAIIPFNAEAWVNFKRGVAADGAISPIALAQNLQGVKMDVPKGKP